MDQSRTGRVLKKIVPELNYGSLACDRDKPKTCSETLRKMESMMRNRSGYRENVKCTVRIITKKARVKITTRYLPCSFLVSTPCCEASLETAAGFVRTRKALGILIFFSCPVLISGAVEFLGSLTKRAEDGRSCRRCYT